jgi:hypothetical protein
MSPVRPGLVGVPTIGSCLLGRWRRSDGVRTFIEATDGSTAKFTRSTPWAIGLACHHMSRASLLSAQYYANLPKQITSAGAILHDGPG